MNHILSVLLALSSVQADLPLEEKVGQILMVHFRGETINPEAKTLIQDLHVGGIIYYTWANGLHSFEQAQTLSQDLQSLAQIPLLIAVDQEGGRITRLTQGFTTTPSNQTLGMSSMPQLAYECAELIGQELLAAGVNFNLAPVIDINSNPDNLVIGSRSFGPTPEIVASFGQSALAGYRQSGVLSCLKHFPGHGDAALDPHYALPVLDKSLEALQKCELIPFERLCSSADAVMTAHLLIPAIDSMHCATLSKSTLDLLRKMGFEGVILSDSLVMEGVLQNCNGSIEEAAICAFNAGCDILLLGGKQLQGASQLELTVEGVQKVFQALIQAVQEGRISQERLDASLQRIAALKDKLPRSQ